MGSIVLLDELTINKIAAGEVIERPASVVKEMVENSIDAGASIINIEIKNGGISYIRITDNGKGIESDDLEIAFERHATSKIRSADDLNVVKSMGFRGEALASIASIANVEMISRTTNSPIGNKIIVEAGKVLSMEETGCQIGTTITVQNLFFNTPVRYKFLKKDYTETGYIEDTITRLALIHPDIAFRLINTGKTIIQTSGNGKIQDVIYAIYGKDIANSILEVDYLYEDIHVTGVVGKPEIARSNRSNQIFFVNQRFVKDKTLSAATENSFKGLLPIGKYGFLVLNIDMDPAKVDVNVHPAKLEVRFQEENKVFKAIYHAIKETLLKAELIANTEKIPEQVMNMPPKEEKTSIAGLFREITKKQQKDQETNVIEQIYQNKEKEEKVLLKEEPVLEIIKKEPTRQNTSEITPKQDKKMDVFKELLAMQQRLKKEAEENPNLHTNIDELIKSTKNLETGGVLSEVQNTEVKNEKLEEQVKQDVANTSSLEITEKNPIVPEFHKDTVENTIEKTIEQANTLLELQHSTISYSTPKEETTKEPFVPLQEEETTYEPISAPVLEDQEIQKQKEWVPTLEEDSVPEVIPEENKLEVEPPKETSEVSQATRVFTSAEIQEMMEKLEKIENVEESPEFSNMYEKIFGKLPASVEEEKREEEKKISAYELIKDNNVSVFESIEEYQKPVYKLVGIAFNTYIIIEIQNELYIIDQHAAHERVMYEKVKENYYSDSSKDSQMLLLPDVITLSHKEMDILRDNYEMFEKAGFSLEEFGENTIKLSGVPNICLELDTKELFLETLDEINQVARTAKQEIEERFIATVACKAAVKANMNLTPEEVESLMNDLLKLPNPFTCPHGRPTAIKMDQNDLEKKFARRK